MKLNSILNQIEKRLPIDWQENWDHCGLNLGSRNQNIKTVLFSFDICKEVVEYAIQNNCQLIVSHHPFRMSSDVDLDLDSYEGQLIKHCIQNQIALYSMHTNHDSSPESLNHFYLQKLQLQNIKPLLKHNTNDPALGLGAFGTAKNRYKKTELISLLKKIFKTPNIRWVDSGKKSFQKIGICTGSGSSLLGEAIAQELDLFITGDMKYHQAITAKRNDLAVADMGHFYSEKSSITVLKNIFKEEFDQKLNYQTYSKLKDAFEFV